MFDWFMGEEARIAKRQRLLTDKAQPADEREAVTEWLVSNGTPKAVVALLTRFDMTLEHQILDQKEKDRVYQNLVELGTDKVGRAVRAHLKRCKQVTFPLRLLEQLDGSGAVMDFVLELLAVEAQRRDFKAERKFDSLTWLADCKDPRALAAASEHIGDFDEGVRCAAVGAILGQGDAKGREVLEARIVDASEDSNRLKVRVASAFAQRRWKVGDVERVTASLPPGFVVREGTVVQTG